jgi:hypothetical protein
LTRNPGKILILFFNVNFLRVKKKNASRQTDACFVSKLHVTRNLDFEFSPGEKIYLISRGGAEARRKRRFTEKKIEKLSPRTSVRSVPPRFSVSDLISFFRGATHFWDPEILLINIFLD